MVAEGPSRGPRVLRNQPPLDADQIVVAAVRLTRLNGLDHWTLRQLANELGCWPAVIYHHVGDRAELTNAVVNHVVGMVQRIEGSPPWRECFRRLLCDLRIVLRQHPGVARWLALSGPVVPAMLQIIDSGVQVLARAGLGDEAAVAYSVLINSAVLLIAIEDDRDAQPILCEEVWQTLDGYRDSAVHPGLAAMAVTALDKWGVEAFYRYSIERALDGIEVRLATLAQR